MPNSGIVVHPQTVAAGRRWPRARRLSFISFVQSSSRWRHTPETVARCARRLRHFRYAPADNLTELRRIVMDRWRRRHVTPALWRHTWHHDAWCKNLEHPLCRPSSPMAHFTLNFTHFRCHGNQLPGSIRVENKRRSSVAGIWDTYLLNQSGVIRDVT